MVGSNKKIIQSSTRWRREWGKAIPFTVPLAILFLCGRGRADRAHFNDNSSSGGNGSCWVVGAVLLFLFWAQNCACNVHETRRTPLTLLPLRNPQFPHATGVVIGETVVMGRCCSMLHGVTLGATGKDRGDRHPKIGNGVSIGAGASILGNIRIGDYAKIGCGSVVLQPVPEGATAVGIPCRIIPSRRGSGIPSTPTRAYVDHSLDDCDPFYRSAWKTMTEMGLQMRHGDLVTFEKFRAAVTRCGASEYDASNMFFQMDVHHHGVLTLDELRNSFSATSLQNPDSHFNASVDDLVRNLDLVHNFSRTA